MFVLTATYETLLWTDPEEEEGYERIGGYTDPRNPWGGFKTEIPEELYGEAFAQWRDTEIIPYLSVSFDTVWEAAEFANDFPGGVWNYSESESEQDYRTGEYKSVTLHVHEGSESSLFEVMDLIKSPGFNRSAYVGIPEGVCE